MAAATPAPAKPNYWEDPEYIAAARQLRASLRPLTTRILAARGLTWDDWDRAMAGDTDSPAYPHVATFLESRRAA